MKVIPTIFAKNRKEFDEGFNKVVNLTKDIQIDFMDGKFVKAKGIKLNDVPNLSKIGKNFEAHLMVKNPEKYLTSLKKKGFSKTIFHYQAMKNEKAILNLIKAIKKKKMKAWIAFNPEVVFENIIWIISLFKRELDGILLMGVKPGKEKQKFISKTLDKIKEIRGINKSIKIQIDGGVNDKTIIKMKNSGVNYVNTGSFVSKAKDSEKVFKLLKKKFD